MQRSAPAGVPRDATALTRASGNHAPGLRLIIAYKLTRAAASLFAAALLAAFTAADHATPLHTVAVQIRHHAASAWSIAIADVLVSAVAPQHLWLVVLALALDGAFTFVEGWALHRTWWWGPWLVVIATGGFLPFEAIAIVRHADVGRVLLLGLNSLVALYLARRAHDRSSGSFFASKLGVEPNLEPDAAGSFRHGVSVAARVPTRLSRRSAWHASCSGGSRPRHASQTGTREESPMATVRSQLRNRWTTAVTPRVVVTESSPTCGAIPLAAARRAESLRQLGLLSAGVAHDMRNVLNGLSLRIQILQGTGSAAGEVAACLAQMRRDVSLGAQLLERVRELGRCEPSIAMERVELDDVLADACQLARFHSPAGRPTTTEIVCDGASPVVFAQRSEMVSAVLNLLLNAVDASPRGGKITARTGSDRGTSFVEIEDEGPGIPPAVQARMFEPYFTTKGNDGTGLGLASVAECARRHRGEVRVTTGLHGTTIALVLPSASSQGSTPDAVK